MLKAISLAANVNRPAPVAAATPAKAPVRGNAATEATVAAAYVAALTGFSLMASTTTSALCSACLSLIRSK